MATIESLMESRVAQKLSICLYSLWKGWAIIDFPTTNRSHPSREVVISMTPNKVANENWKRFFPFSVRGPYWNRVMVPIFKNPYWRGKMKILNQSDFLLALERGILEKANEEGFLLPR